MTSSQLHYLLEEKIGYSLPLPREPHYVRLAMYSKDNEIRDIAEELVDVLV